MGLEIVIATAIVLFLVLIFSHILSRKKKPTKSSSGQLEPYVQRAELAPLPPPRVLASASAPAAPAISLNEEPSTKSDVTEQELRNRLFRATTEEECAEIYHQAPYGSALERDAVKRLDGFLLQRLAAATTVDECEEIWKDHLSDDSSIETRVDDMIIAILTGDLATATTVDECEEIYERIPSDNFEEKGSLGKSVVLKMLELSTTNEMCIDLFNYLENDEIDNELYDKILRKALELAETSDECGEVEAHSSEDFGPDEDEVGQRKVELAETLEECIDIWEACDDTDSVVYRAAICKAADMIRAEQANTKQ